MESITKQDLEILRHQIVKDLEPIVNSKDDQFDWMRSKKIRKLMDISPATLQNFRISGKIRHKKIMGSYYYSRKDLLNLFEDAQ